jgi:hypothetical protein
MYTQKLGAHMRRGKRILHLAFLVGFLFISLCINFLHTEKTVKSDYVCPACHFLASALTTGHIHFFSLPRLIFQAIITSQNSPSVVEVFLISPQSRAPPQA